MVFICQLFLVFGNSHDDTSLTLRRNQAVAQSPQLRSCTQSPSTLESLIPQVVGGKKRFGEINIFSYLHFPRNIAKTNWGSLRYVKKKPKGEKTVL